MTLYEGLMRRMACFHVLCFHVEFLNKKRKKRKTGDAAACTVD